MNRQKNAPKRASHGFPEYVPDRSEILILGSFPSVKSRAEEFYYAHPRNRFWRVISGIYGLPEPENLSQKKQLLDKCGVALWDVLESCEIVGSSDLSIKNAVPVDLRALLKSHDFRLIVLNGKTAERLYLKHFGDISLPRISLPSTSPANASWSCERLIDEWKKIII